MPHALTLLAALPLVAAAPLAAQCASKHNGSTNVVVINWSPDLPDLFELALGNNDLDTLSTLVAVADLDEPLRGGEFTVFAPTDDAFGDLGDDAVAGLTRSGQREQLATVLKYHVVPGRITASDIPQGRTTVETLAGETLTIKRDGDDITVNGRNVIAADVAASNGVAHVIDGVLLPDEQESRSVRDQVVMSGGFETLEAAVRAAGFERSLDRDGPYTVFAPTDDAFEALPDGTLDTLLQHSGVHDLRAVLRLHILAGEVDARGAIVAEEAQSRQGSTLRFEIDGGQLFVVGPVNRARVIETNVRADNGIVHVIDTVLLLPS
jgi:uncharacterized surface protein with fasciclin (FAS1) repeats